MVICFQEKLDFPMRKKWVGCDFIHLDCEKYEFHHIEKKIILTCRMYHVCSKRKTFVVWIRITWVLFSAGLFTRSHNFIMNSICTSNWEIHSIFKHLTISKSITSVYTWAWTGGFSVLQTSTKIVKSFTCSNFFFSLFFVMLKFPMKMQTAICHMSIFNRKKLEKCFGSWFTASCCSSRLKQLLHTFMETKSLHPFSPVLVEMTIFRHSDGVFCACFIKCTSSSLSGETIQE